MPKRLRQHQLRAALAAGLGPTQVGPSRRRETPGPRPRERLLQTASYDRYGRLVQRTLYLVKEAPASMGADLIRLGEWFYDTEGRILATARGDDPLASSKSIGGPVTTYIYETCALGTITRVSGPPLERTAPEESKP